MNAPARTPMAQTTSVTPHNRARWLLVGVTAAIVLVAIGAYVASRGRDNTPTVDSATVAAAPTTGIVATLPPGVPTPTPLATAPPTAAPTVIPTIPPTAPPPAAASAQSQPLVVPAPRQAPAAANPGKGKGKGKDEKKGDD